MWIVDELPVSRLLVVRGMGENQMLLSVRGIKKDGVYSYFNDDNSLGISDCMRLPSGTDVPFMPSTHAYNLSVEEHAQAGTEAMHPRDRQRRSPQVIHASLGHSGSRRINNSNISIDGQLVNMPEHHEESCPGCRLGNTRAKGTCRLRKRHGERATRAWASRTLASRWTQISVRDFSHLSPTGSLRW